MLDLEQFVAKEAERILTCEEDSRSRGRATKCPRTTSHSYGRKIVATSSDFTDTTALWSQFRRKSRRFFDTNLIFENRMAQKNWPELTQRMFDPHPKSRSLKFDTWLDAISDASDRVRFECCLDPQHFFRLKSHMSGKHTSTIQNDLELQFNRRRRTDRGRRQ